jgi:hypothetical protein
MHWRYERTILGVGHFYLNENVCSLHVQHRSGCAKLRGHSAGDYIHVVSLRKLTAATVLALRISKIPSIFKICGFLESVAVSLLISHDRERFQG